MSTRDPLSNSQPHPSDEELRVVYQELCTSYHNIAEFRSKLLGLLPFVTASSFVATMIGDPSKSLPLARLVLPFGLFGALVTLALFLYEVDQYPQCGGADLLDHLCRLDLFSPLVRPPRNGDLCEPVGLCHQCAAQSPLPPTASHADQQRLPSRRGKRVLLATSSVKTPGTTWEKLQERGLSLST